MLLFLALACGFASAVWYDVPLPVASTGVTALGACGELYAGLDNGFIYAYVSASVPVKWNVRATLGSRITAFGCNPSTNEMYAGTASGKVYGRNGADWVKIGSTFSSRVNSIVYYPRVSRVCVAAGSGVYCWLGNRWDLAHSYTGVQMNSIAVFGSGGSQGLYACRSDGEVAGPITAGVPSVELSSFQSVKLFNRTCVGLATSGGKLYAGGDYNVGQWQSEVVSTESRLRRLNSPSWTSWDRVESNKGVIAISTNAADGHLVLEVREPDFLAGFYSYVEAGGFQLLRSGGCGDRLASYNNALYCARSSDGYPTMLQYGGNAPATPTPTPTPTPSPTPTPTPTPTPCNDPDKSIPTLAGDDVLIKTTVTGSYQGGTRVLTDRCVDDTTVLEMVCSLGIPTGKQWVCNSGYVCSDGACVKPPSTTTPTPIPVPSPTPSLSIDVAPSSGNGPFTAQVSGITRFVPAGSQVAVSCNVNGLAPSIPSPAPATVQGDGGFSTTCSFPQVSVLKSYSVRGSFTAGSTFNSNVRTVAVKPPCNPACDLGSFSPQCVGNSAQACVLDANDCPIITFVSCANGCFNGACRSCTDACTAGAARCFGGNAQSCERSANSCFNWETMNCGANGCFNGACRSCSDECTQGAKRCSTAGDVESCNLGPTGCTAWQPLQSCANSCNPVTSSCHALPSCTASTQASRLVAPGQADFSVRIDYKRLVAAGEGKYVSLDCNANAAQPGALAVEGSFPLVTDAAGVFSASKVCEFPQVDIPTSYSVAFSVEGVSCNSLGVTANPQASCRLSVSPSSVQGPADIAVGVALENYFYADARQVRINCSSPGELPAPLTDDIIVDVVPSGNRADILAACRYPKVLSNRAYTISAKLKPVAGGAELDCGASGIVISPGFVPVCTLSAAPSSGSVAFNSTVRARFEGVSGATFGAVLNCDALGATPPAVPAGSQALTSSPVVAGVAEFSLNCTYPQASGVSYRATANSTVSNCGFAEVNALGSQPAGCVVFDEPPCDLPLQDGGVFASGCPKPKSCPATVTPRPPAPGQLKGPGVFVITASSSDGVTWRVTSKPVALAGSA